jgi:hypothetical protein
MRKAENKSVSISDQIVARPWSVPVKRGDVPETGRHFDLTPDRTVREPGWPGSSTCRGSRRRST